VRRRGAVRPSPRRSARHGRAACVRSPPSCARATGGHPSARS
jgi:hypothetical protein